MVIGLSGVHPGLQSYLVTKNMISDSTTSFLPINHKNYNLREKMITQNMKKRENLHLDWQGDLCFYGDWNRGCDWLI